MRRAISPPHWFTMKNSVTEALEIAIPVSVAFGYFDFVVAAFGKPSGVPAIQSVEPDNCL